MNRQLAPIRPQFAGGEPVAPGAWPMLVWLDNGCTAVLLADDIAYSRRTVGQTWTGFLGETLDISIDDDAGSARAAAGANVQEAHTLDCTLHPNLELGTATDVAFCKLESAVIARSEVIHPALGCGRARMVSDPRPHSSGSAAKADDRLASSAQKRARVFH